MHDFTTPMMKQYMEIKKQYQDCLLFFRMGDFYELFLDDAHIGSQVLNITLTSRAKGKDGRIPMAGVPYHAVDTYLAKLVQAGYKVAICEQVSLPNKYGIVDREVIRVVTPGTVLDEKALEKSENNYLVALSHENAVLSLAVADVSTGYFAAYSIEYTDLAQAISDELSKYSPKECILPEILYNDPDFLSMLRTERTMNIFSFPNWNIYAPKARSFLMNHFAVQTLVGFGFEDTDLALAPAASLLGYLQETQKSGVSHIGKLTKIMQSDHVVLDRSTMINLELFSTIREHDVKGSLLSVLDETLTPMGGRLLKAWIKKPLALKEQIKKRLDAVEEITQEHDFCDGVRSLLQVIPDIERTLSRLSLQIGNARDIVNLKHALVTVLAIREALESANSALLKELYSSIDTQLATLVNCIEKQIVAEPPLEVREGGMIQDGVNKELDELRKITMGSRDWIVALEASERQKTGISSLKVRFNKVFGFYIEVSKANLSYVPVHYMRKQTLVNGERYITEELKHHEDIILTAEEKIKQIEYGLYQDILSTVLSFTPAIQGAADAIGVLDCLTNFAVLSQKNNYTKPKMIQTGEMYITGGRHPVVEKLLDDMPFVPNDVLFGTASQQQMLITGPNMAGKSVFIRQIALIALMAQIGCFVPAQSARLSIVDRIFVRSGASDVITSGLSTFMVEMVETAHILHHATKNSLIVMDEIGRGTSTYDGISIAWAVAEYLATAYTKAPKVLFATHYHELQKLEEEYPKKIRNFHMAVADNNGMPVFLHTIQPGGASHSYGVAVARLAGVPESVIIKAEEMLRGFEERNQSKESSPQANATKFSEKHTTEYSILNTSLVDRFIHKELEKIDISRLTPLEALNKLAELKEQLRFVDKDVMNAD